MMATKNKEVNNFHLNLHKVWFDLIASGRKKEEYREITPYWVNRLMNARKNYKERLPHLRADYTPKDNRSWIIFQNGYQKNARTMGVELLKLSIDYPVPAWCPPETDLLKKVFVLKLGPVYYVRDKIERDICNHDSGDTVANEEGFEVCPQCGKYGGDC